MPSLLDAADAFSKLGKKSIEINEAACVRVRHRHASCQLCLRVCSHEAITIEDNILAIDNHRCTGCGACASVCPTEALSLIENANETLQEAIDRAAANTTIEVSCEYARNQHDAHAEAEQAQPWREQAQRVPCLATLDESTLIHAACAEVSLHYVSGECAQCPNANGALIEEIIEQAQGFLSALSLPCEQADRRPHWSIYRALDSAQDKNTSPEMSRRGMFDHFVERTTDSIAEAAVGTFYVNARATEEKPTLAQTLLMAKGVLKQIDVWRTTRILNDLYRMLVKANSKLTPESTRDDTNIPTRLFGEIDLDVQRCDLCGICMTFCPTKAIDGIPSPPANPLVAATREVELSGELSFRANDCVACRLCVDLCPRDALTFRSGIALQDLFALERKTLLAK